MKISIAMATYNGARFIQQQLDSLATQTLLPHELVICDDGSSDATLEIAQTFSENSPFPVRIYRNEKNLGYADNFLKAASLCEGDWIAFCDQDDVWLPHKLETVAAYFLDDVLLVIHSADLVDGDLKPQGRRCPDLKQTTITLPLHNRPWWTPAGFTQCVKADLIRDFDWSNRPHDFNYPEKIQAHDQWTYFLANSIGKIAHIKDSLALYRRHEHAVTGSYSNSMAERARGIRSATGAHYAMLSRIAQEYADTAIKLEQSKKHAEKYKERLQIASGFYLELSKATHARSLIHSDLPRKQRIGGFLSLLRSRAYSDAKGKGLGYKALLKDLAGLA